MYQNHVKANTVRLSCCSIYPSRVLRICTVSNAAEGASRMLLTRSARSIPLRLNRRNHNQLHHQACVSSAVKLEPENSSRSQLKRRWRWSPAAGERGWRGWIIGYTPQKHFEHNQPSISRTAGRTSHTRAPLPTNTFYNALPPPPLPPACVCF